MMRGNNLLRNILLAFLFFFIGRLIVLQMGDFGYWAVGGLVIAFYIVWFFMRRGGKKES